MLREPAVTVSLVAPDRLAAVASRAGFSGAGPDSDFSFAWATRGLTTMDTRLGASP